MTTQRPVRTCIGCRERATAADLLRVVVVPDVTGAAMSPDRPSDGCAGSVARVVPDLRQRLAGRGAWLHPDLRCAELAQRRRAYARALRVPEPVDPSSVLEYVSAAGGSTMKTSQRSSGTPQES